MILRYTCKLHDLASAHFFPSAYPDNMLFSTMSFISFAMSGTMLLANPSARLFPLSSAARQARILATALQLAGGFALPSAKSGSQPVSTEPPVPFRMKKKEPKKNTELRLKNDEECVEIVFIHFFRRQTTNIKHHPLPLSEGGGALTSDLVSSSLQYCACLQSRMKTGIAQLPKTQENRKVWTKVSTCKHCSNVFSIRMYA